MSSFDEGRVPEEDLSAVPLDLYQDRVCHTCRHCTWSDGNKCGVELLVDGEVLTSGLGILLAYRLCRGKHWQEQEFEE